MPMNYTDGHLCWELVVHNPIKMEDNQRILGNFDINGSGGIPLPPSLPYHKKLLLEGLARHEAFKDLRLTADFEPKFDELYTMLRGNPLFIEVMSIIALTHAKKYDFDFSGVALANDAEKYHNQWERVVKFVDPAPLQGAVEGQNDAGEGEDVIPKDIFIRTLEGYGKKLKEQFELEQEFKLVAEETYDDLLKTSNYVVKGALLFDQVKQLYISTTTSESPNGTKQSRYNGGHEDANFTRESLAKEGLVPVMLQGHAGMEECLAKERWVEFYVKYSMKVYDLPSPEKEWERLFPDE